MSFKIRLLKWAIKWTPKTLVLWVANTVLKGIAEMGDFSFDPYTRQAYVQATLCGEAQALEVWIDGFTLLRTRNGYQFELHQARANRLWLSNIISRIVGKPWPIPDIPQLAAPLALLAELFAPEPALVEGSCLIVHDENRD